MDKTGSTLPLLGKLETVTVWLRHCCCATAFKRYNHLVCNASIKLANINKYKINASLLSFQLFCTRVRRSDECLRTEGGRAQHVYVVVSDMLRKCKDRSHVGRERPFEQIVAEIR